MKTIIDGRATLGLLFLVIKEKFFNIFYFGCYFNLLNNYEQRNIMKEFKHESVKKIGTQLVHP